MTARSQAAQLEAAERLDRALNAIRRARGLTWREFAAEAAKGGYRLSYETLRSARKGESVPRDLTASAIEYIAGWAPGSLEDVMAGKEPTSVNARRFPGERPKYDDPALQAVWDIELLDEDERRAAITAIRIIRENKGQAGQSDQRAYG
ncbi:hypothetical protein [Actinoallomurus iriomotensis]|uniref:Uncharacterized protein n=1 Tax=Actinoallomurus iriomotensis TaxID=478107 RepID=A0A9W6RXF7_9ACTN|nr:hypothetical protein [Actinoallomurus iriomotensis]GLY81887.1 hypothetical protein Airi01_101540 [Actinoallomurus iriomotensis]